MTSCTTLTPSSPPSRSWNERQHILTNIQSWQLEAKIAVQTDRDSGSAFVNWSQQPNRYEISLLGPLGVGGFKLTGQTQRVILVTTDGKRYTANNPEQLLAAQWGYHLPISFLRYWIRGLPVAGIAYQSQFDANLRLTQLVQQNWTIHFQSYATVGTIELPERITITSSLLKAKIAIYRWKIH